MNFWIGVAFFCMGENCAFWKADQNFYNKDECEAKVRYVINGVEEAGGIGDGVCLPVKANET